MVSNGRARRRSVWQSLEAGRSTGQPPVALVTGAAGGIGAAFAHALAARGWALALVDLDEDRLRAVTEALRSEGAAVESAAIDLGTPEGPAAAVGLALERWGRLELVVPFAGIFVEPSVRCQPPLRRLLRATNLWHPLACAQLALERADVLEHPCIAVMPLSDAGLRHRDPWPYARAKAELQARAGGLSRQWRHRADTTVFAAVVYPTHTEFSMHSDAVIVSHLGSLPAEHADHRGLESLLSTAPAPEAVVAQILDALAAGRRDIYLDPGGPRQRAAARWRGEVLGPIVDVLPARVRGALRVQPRYDPGGWSTP